MPPKTTMEGSKRGIGIRVKIKLRKFVAVNNQDPTNN